ncbi:MAG TPA: hypothetical protein VFS21_38250 [Roseiflexaceae bacterium]|nr:hypothetical protein [Roseiflexaceae bacterium]
MLLFLSQPDDLHTDFVEAACRRRGVPFVRFCTRDFPQRVGLRMELHGEHLTGALALPEGELPLEVIAGVWFRRPEAPEPHPELDETYHAFALQESRAALNGLYRALWDRAWVNPPHHDASANHKLYQLDLARRLGFAIPETLLTNRPEEAEAFFHACGGQMIYKLMFPLFVNDADGEPLGVFTTLIDRDSFAAHLQGVRAAPCLFQALIPKRYELRVNVIGSHVWASAIYSQERDTTSLDYRHDTEGCRHEPVQLPPAVERRCREIARRMGLRMCSIDIIVDRNGEYVFLEVNSNGQWAWIEQQVRFPLADALIDELLKKPTD